MKNLTTRVPNYTQFYFPYSMVTSACQDSGLACTSIVTNFGTLTYMQKQTQLFYQHTPIDTAIYEKFVC